MLTNLNDDIIECYRYAQECARRANAERNARSRQDYLDMERRWLFLARSYEFTEQLERFQPRRKR